MEAREQENERGTPASNFFPAREWNLAKAQDQAKSHPLHRHQNCKLPKQTQLRHMSGLLDLGFLQKEEEHSTNLVKCKFQ